MHSNAEIIIVMFSIISVIAIIWIIVGAIIQIKRDISIGMSNVIRKRIGFALIIFIVRICVGMVVNNIWIFLFRILECIIMSFACCYFYNSNKLKKE